MRVAPFKMERHGQPIENVGLRNKLDVGIFRSQHLLEWDSAIEAGATLDELYKWEKGEYPNWFKGMVIVWYERKNQYEAHIQDAQAQAQERAMKRK